MGKMCPDISLKIDVHDHLFPWHVDNNIFKAETGLFDHERDDAL